MSRAECCNAECEWTGPVSECVMLGEIGPLCPVCREVVEPCEICHGYGPNNRKFGKPGYIAAIPSERIAELAAALAASEPERESDAPQMNARAREWVDRAHRACMNPTRPRQSIGEMLAALLDAARTPGPAGAAAPEGSPAPEPRTPSERETLADRLMTAFIAVQLDHKLTPRDWLLDLLAEAATALRAPSQQAGPTREQVEALLVDEYDIVNREIAGRNGGIEEVLALWDAAPQEEGPPA